MICSTASKTRNNVNIIQRFLGNVKWSNTYLRILETWRQVSLFNLLNLDYGEVNCRGLLRTTRKDKEWL